jgi:sugar fermentation stimulation protein A
MKKTEYAFDVPLIEGIIQTRKSQFTINVEVGGENIPCHCPTTGRIGNIELSGRPCLLSKASDPSRKTPYTVEAVSLNRSEDSKKSWIGINQNAVNRYVEHYLINGGFSDMVEAGGMIQREQFLGLSKLDFLVGNTYLEVKTPLQSLQVEIPDYVKTKKNAPFSSTERFVKHITELANSLQSHQIAPERHRDRAVGFGFYEAKPLRAILLTCFLYDNPGFEVVERSTNYEQVSAAVSKATAAGVEIWQANFKITPSSVELTKYFRLSL